VSAQVCTPPVPQRVLPATHSSVQGPQSESRDIVHPEGQHPSPFAQVVMGVEVHIAAQVPPPVSEARAQALMGEQVVGHAPVMPAAMPVSQSSPVSTTPLPQRTAQSLSLVELHVEGQHPSALMHPVMGVVSQTAAQVPAPVSRVVLHVPVDAHDRGHAPVMPAAMAVSHDSPTSTRPLPQVAVHMPAAQVWPVVHARPQAPQLVGDERRSTSQPFAAMPSQSAKPSAQVMPHTPAAHDAVALAREGQAFPHAPQWAMAARVSTSQPSEALPLQSRKFAAQV
jgi:hypothetical protein